MGNEQAKLSPDELRELEESTYFDKRELQKWFREFMKDCPSGTLSQDDFVRWVLIQKLIWYFTPSGLLSLDPRLHY